MKARKVYYKLADNLSLRLDSFLATLEPALEYNHIILDNYDSYKLVINNANVFVHDHQVKKIVEELIGSLFKNLASSISINFEPRDLLKVTLILANMVPVNIEGKIRLDSQNNTIIYQFDNLTVMKIPCNSIIDALKMIPGLIIGYKSKDGKSKLENDQIIIYLNEFVKDLKANFTLSDIYFSEDGLFFELSGKQVSKIEYNSNEELPDSFVSFSGDSIKVDNLEVYDARILVYKEDKTAFAFNFATYKDIVYNSVVSYGKNKDITLKIIKSTEE